MSRTFVISGHILWIISSIILSLTSSYQASNGSHVQTSLNWCSQKHCEDCNSSKVSICANGALSNRCGDLCGCCHSCVQIRDVGDSCGSQLTVRSSAVQFDNSKLEITVLATTSCRLGLDCINFTCQTLRDEAGKLTTAPVELVDAKIDVKFRSFGNDTDTFEDSDDLKTNEIPVERTDTFYYRHSAYDDVEQNADTSHVLTTRKIDPRTSTSSPIHLKTAIKSEIKIGKDEIPFTQSETTSLNTESQSNNTQHQVQYTPKNLFDSSRRLVNVIMGGREFQLIYSHEALIDLKLLLNSIDKNQSTSILDEFEALLLYERFKDVLEVVSKDKQTSSLKDFTPFSSATAEKQDHRENENRRLIESFRDSGLAILKKFIVPHMSRLARPRVPSRLFRRKRELEENEERESSDDAYSEVVIYDFLNKTPRTLEDSAGHWLFAREVGLGSEESLSSSQPPKSEGIESAINIHIIGIPRVTKLTPETDLVEKVRIRNRRTDDEDYENYDDKLEIFVSNANTNVPEFSRADENLRNSENLTSPISQSYENFDSNEDQIDNTTENYSDTSNSFEKNSQYYDNNYEFTFPETPVSLESDYYHDLRLQVNETVDEFKAQLDRIETKVFVIESSLWDMTRKLETIGRSDNNGDMQIIESTNTSGYSHNQRSNLTGSSQTGANLRRSRTAKPEEVNQFIRRYVLLPQTKDFDVFKENSTSSDTQNYKNFNIEDEGIAQFIPIRSNRQWRTVTLQPSSAEQRKFSKSRGRRYPNSEGSVRVNDEFQRDSRRRKVAQRRPIDSRHRDFVARRLHPRKVLKNDRNKEGRRIQSPIFSSNGNTRSKDNRNQQNLFSREQYSLRFTSDPSSSNQQVVWPLNPAWKRPLSVDARKRVQINRRSKSNHETDEKPSFEKSVVMLETQIPTPLIPARKSAEFDNRMAESSMSFAAAVVPLGASMKHSFNDEYDWNWSSWNEAPSLNLFIVNGNSSSEFEKETSSSSQEMTEALVLPMANGNSGMEDGWEFAYPVYLDYSEASNRSEELEKEESLIMKEKATESPVDHRISRRMITDSRERKKRDVSDTLQDDKFNRKLISSSNNKFTNTRNVIQDKNTFQKRSKRNVRMVDWLRAAQEYHERLHQVRNAALRTWLASREELADTNLTDVKLFTSEVPTYLEKYKPSFTTEDDSVLESEASQAYPIEIRDPRSPIPDDSELFTEFLYNQSALLENDSKPRMNVKHTQDSRREMNSAAPRKITIIATGNSTIRIEELPSINEGNDDSLLEDQSAQGSTKSEQAMAQQITIATSDSEDFDHMYESIDAEDEDFDYGDPNFTLSRWLDEVDIIDAASVEIPGDKTKSMSDSFNDKEDYEVDELLSRSKRDSPLFLFKIKGNPSQEVLIWPANWKDFIDRYFKRNRTTNSLASPQRLTKTSQTRISKIGLAKPPISNADRKITSKPDAEISSSGGALSGDDSGLELDLVKKLQHAFDNRPRQNRRKNNGYRRSIGNYK